MLCHHNANKMIGPFWLIFLHRPHKWRLVLLEFIVERGYLCPAFFCKFTSCYLVVTAVYYVLFYLESLVDSIGIERFRMFAFRPGYKSHLWYFGIFGFRNPVKRRDIRQRQFGHFYTEGDSWRLLLYALRCQGLFLLDKVLVSSHYLYSSCHGLHFLDWITHRSHGDIWRHHTGLLARRPRLSTAITWSQLDTFTILAMLELTDVMRFALRTIFAIWLAKSHWR